MAPSMDPSTDGPDRGASLARWRSEARLVAAVTERDDGPDQCTIFPATVSSRDERRSAWITAEGEAFVDAGATR